MQNTSILSKTPIHRTRAVDKSGRGDALTNLQTSLTTFPTIVLNVVNVNMENRYTLLINNPAASREEIPAGIIR